VVGDLYAGESGNVDSDPAPVQSPQVREESHDTGPCRVSYFHRLPCYQPQRHVPLRSRQVRERIATLEKSLATEKSLVLKSGVYYRERQK
jgi:hypothetical protein